MIFNQVEHLIKMVNDFNKNDQFFFVKLKI